MKYLGKSSKKLIEGAVSLTSTKDLLDIFLRKNITYPLNYQLKFNNTQRMLISFAIGIITTNVGKSFFLGK